jgi:hypothetical protein
VEGAVDGHPYGSVGPLLAPVQLARIAGIASTHGHTVSLLRFAAARRSIESRSARSSSLGERITEVGYPAAFFEGTAHGDRDDGGIDGHGVLEVNPLVTFKVLFQCKRYGDRPVTPSQVRDFRLRPVKAFEIQDGFFDEFR